MKAVNPSIAACKEGSVADPLAKNPRVKPRYGFVLAQYPALDDTYRTESTRARMSAAKASRNPIA